MPVSVVQVVLDDRSLDRMIDDLTEKAGYERGMTSPLNLARWDLSAVLKKEAARQRGECRDTDGDGDCPTCAQEGGCRY